MIGVQVEPNQSKNFNQITSNEAEQSKKSSKKVSRM